MWIAHVDILAGTGEDRTIQSRTTHALHHSHTYAVGRTAECEIKVDSKSVSKKAGRIIVYDVIAGDGGGEEGESWSGEQYDEDGLVIPSRIEYWNDSLRPGSKSSLPDPPMPDRKNVTMHIANGNTPRNEYGRVDSAKAAQDMSGDNFLELNTWGKTVVGDGTRIYLTQKVRLIIEWKDFSIVDLDQTALGVDTYEQLKGWGVSHTRSIQLNATTHLISPTISPTSPACNNAVSLGLKIAHSEYPRKLLAALNSAEKEKVAVVFPNEEDEMPEIDTREMEEGDERREKGWWTARRERRRVWEGMTVVIAGGSTVSREDSYLKHSGVVIHAIDIVTRPPRNVEAYQKKIKPFLQKAKDHRRKYLESAGQSAEEDEEDAANALVVLYRDGALDRVQEKWEDLETSYGAVFFDGLRDMNIPFEFLHSWWMALTNMDPQDIFTKKQPVPAPQAQARPTRSNLSSQASRPETVIPSTVHDEMAGTNKSQNTQEAPAAGGGLKRRAGLARRAAVEDSSSSDDEPPAKRARLGPTPSLASQVPSSLQGEAMQVDKSSAAPPVAPSGLKRRAGQPRAVRNFLDDSRDEDDEDDDATGANALAKYKNLRESSKKTGAQDSQGDGMDVDDIYTQAKSTVDAQNKRDSQQNVSDDDDYVRYEEKKRAEKRRKETPKPAAASKSAEKQPAPADMEITPTPSFKVKPTPPDQISKDTEFLQRVAKAKKGKNAIDDFDREFNALKIAKPSKNQTGLAVNRTKETEEELYKLLENMGESTGNFMVIEKIEVFRKEKAERVPANNPEWAGKPNFKKFKKQQVNRRPPVPMALKAITDYGLGTTYWANEGVAPPTAEPASQSQATSQSQSTMSTQPTQLKGRGKRKLLAGDSDDDDIPVRTPRTRTQASATPEPTGATRRTRRTTPSESGDDLPRPTRGKKKAAALTPIPDLEEDEAYDPWVGPRAGGTRGASSVGDSTQADEALPSRGSTSGTGTGRANRKRMLIGSDDDDPSAFRVNKRKKH